MSRDIKRSTARNQPASGRFVLRIPPALHGLLRRSAADAGLSLNDYCARKLSAPDGAALTWPAAATVVERAAGVAGDALVGVVAYGSWARGEATTRSDIDVLIVLDDRTSLTRALYRRWDEKPLEWEGRPVEPHFVRLGRGAPASGLWAEAAIDGLVLFERGLALSVRLAEVRRDIASGRLVRRIAHGQPYWAEVA